MDVWATKYESHNFGGSRDELNALFFLHLRLALYNINIHSKSYAKIKKTILNSDH